MTTLGRLLNDGEWGYYVIDFVDTRDGRYRLLDRRPIGMGFAVRLPSGMCHSFDTEAEARNSQYWTRVNK
jgi:hypothetical protein